MRRDTSKRFTLFGGKRNQPSGHHIVRRDRRENRNRSNWEFAAESRHCRSVNTLTISSGAGTAALLVFLAAAAGARIIAADLIAGTDDLLNRLHVAGSGHAGLFEFTFLLALESLFNIVDGRRYLARRASVAAASSSTD